MQDYLATPWKAVFEHNDLRDFDDFWKLEAEWFEKPNERRGGWSGVARCELNLPEGGTRRIFLKRQENHVTKTWRHPIRGVATLVREFTNFQHFKRYRLPTACVVYFAQRNVKGRRQAVLATEELTGFRSLEDLTKQWLKEGWPKLVERRRMIEAMAATIRQMHQSHFRHNCLAAKHVFLRIPENDRHPVDVRIIDLEKARWSPFQTSVARGDLSLLHRYCQGWRRADVIRFYKAYLQVNRLRGAKDLWHAIARRNKLKRERRERHKPGRPSRKKIGAPAPSAGPRQAG